MPERIWLSKLRNQLGFTQEQVAELVGIKRAYYSMIERGKRRPSVDVAKRISNVLNFDWTIFFNQQCVESLPKEGHNAETA